MFYSCFDEWQVLRRILLCRYEHTPVSVCDALCTLAELSTDAAHITLLFLLHRHGRADSSIAANLWAGNSKQIWQDPDCWTQVPSIRPLTCLVSLRAHKTYSLQRYIILAAETNQIYYNPTLRGYQILYRIMNLFSELKQIVDRVT
jgi:hypothetical protein